MSDSKKESTTKTFIVAGILCLVCSAIVAGANGLLKGRIDNNKKQFIKQNVLSAAGVLQDGIAIDDQFESWVVEDEYELPRASDSNSSIVDPADPSNRIAMVSIPAASDVAQVKKRETKLKIFKIRSGPGKDTFNKFVVPIRGKGLWSTLKGYLAIDATGTTIKGISYYEHAETPGLGGEVDNPSWKDSWNGKKIFDAEGNIAIRVVKGKATNEFQVDGLSGATITSNGVTNMLKYWLGDDGFGDYIKELAGNSAAESTKVASTSSISSSSVEEK